MEAIYNYNDSGNLVSKITIFEKDDCTNTVMEYDDKDRVIRQVVYAYDLINKKNKDIVDETIITYENDVIVSILNSDGLKLREYNKEIETDRFGTISFDFVQTNKFEDKTKSIYCETERNGIYHANENEENIDVEYDKISYFIDYSDGNTSQSLVLSKDDFTVYIENSYNGEKKNYRITKYNDDKLLESDITVDIVSNQKRNYSCKNKYLASLDELDDNDIVQIDNSDIIEDESIDVKSIKNNYTVKYITENEIEKRDVILESIIDGFDKTDNSYFTLYKISNNNILRKMESRYDIHNRIIQQNIDNTIVIFEYQSDTDNRIKTRTSITGRNLQKIVKINDSIKLTKERKTKDIYLYNEFNDKLITVRYTIDYFNNYCSKYIKITDKDSKTYYESDETSNDNPSIINEILALDK